MKNSFLNIIYPWILGLLLVILSFVLNLNSDINGFENILESIIQFSGLVIGFYTAMYGLVIVAGSKILKKFKDSQLDKVFKTNLIQSLSLSFLAYIISVVMQALRYNKDKIFSIANFDIMWNELGFIIWIFIVGVFIGMSYRSIRLLLKMLFYNDVVLENERESTTHYESDSKKKERYNKLPTRSRTDEGSSD